MKFYPWQRVKVIKNNKVAFDIKSLVLRFSKPVIFKPGQHFELCMPGSNVIRKYSVVSDTSAKQELEFGIQLIENGALSPIIWNLKEGDEVEVRGPIGEYFIWDESKPDPIVLLGGGAGMTTLLSIYNSHLNKYPKSERIFIMSTKDESRIMNYEYIKDSLITRFTNKESRIDANFLKNNIGHLSSNLNTKYYICGPDNFVDDMMSQLLSIGILRGSIQSERFI